MQFTRRSLLQLGLLGLLPPGLLRPGLLRAGTSQPSGLTKTQAKHCILVFMEGGPAHQDLWDMKPLAPREYRGEFEPIASSLTGVPVCEHLPKLAAQMHRVALVRSVHHRIVDHNAGAFYALSGREPLSGSRLIIADAPDNFPPIGAVVGKLHGSRTLPALVHLPEIMSNNGYDIPGQRAGFLGAAHDPFVTGDVSTPGYQVPGLSLPQGDTPGRFEDRKALLRKLTLASPVHAPGVSAAAPAEFAALDTQYAQAFDLIGSAAAKRAFDLSQETDKIRERYGLPDRQNRSVEARQFGGLPHLGQSMLLARRLVEHGVPFVTVCTGRRYDQAWDTHRQHFPLLKRSLLPYFDQAFSALLEDLADRGLLEETLVVAMGEFGRTPRLGQITSGAGAEPAGRDHWPHCYTLLLAGGGVPGGLVHGASDRHAAFPSDKPVTPEEIAATIYALLGVPAEQMLTDTLGRTFSVAQSKPILELLG